MAAAISDAQIPRIEVAVLDRGEDLAALGADWADLLGRTRAFSAALTPEYAEAGWSVAAAMPGTRLAVVTVRRAGRLECVWPLFVGREGGLTIARHLGFGGCEEYAGPLVADGADAAVIAAALAAAKRQADILRIYNLPHEGAAARAIAADGGFRRTSFVLSPVVSLVGVPDWDAWAAKASKKLRAELRHDRKHLAAKGALEFKAMRGSSDGPRCIDWIFDQKRAWIADRGIRNSWMLEGEGTAFFTRLASRSARDDGRPHEVEAYALTLDDQIVAACICFHSGDRLEFYTTAYDPAFSNWSPGGLMIQDCVVMAISDGVDFDFRITQQSYKQRWIDRSDRYDSFMIACSPRGAAKIAAETVAAAIHAQRVRWAPRVKALLGRK